MADVACFCGCCYAFDGDIGVCPKCGEYTSFTHASNEEERQMRDELGLLLRQPAEAEATGGQRRDGRHR
jgi:hypothetical protein